MVALPEGVVESGWPWSICTAVIFALFLIVYALTVSVVPIQRRTVRQEIARSAAIFFVIRAAPVLLEAHFALLKLMFAPASLGIEPGKANSAVSAPSDLFSGIRRLLDLSDRIDPKA